MVRLDVEGLYPSYPHEAGFNAFREALDKRENKHLLKMVEFVLKNNYFEFNGKVKQHLLGTVIGTKFAQTYAGIFMDKLESYFLKSQELTHCFGTVTLTRFSLSGLIVKKNLHHF